jgi:hypothetical protein
MTMRKGGDFFRYTLAYTVEYQKLCVEEYLLTYPARFYIN